MQFNTVIQEVEEIKQSAKLLQEPRVITDLPIGKAVRQGDLYIERVTKEFFEAQRGELTNNSQLAEGDTKGSRHMANINPHTKVYALGNGSGVVTRKSRTWKGRARPCAFAGPLIACDDVLTVTHPEHASDKFINTTKTTYYYQVWVQLDWKRQEKVMD